MRVIKKSVSMLLIMTMIVSLFTIIPIEASAQTGQRVYYKYRYWESNRVKEVVTYQDNVKPLSSCSDDHELSGWYYTDQNFTINSRVKVTDEAHIIMTKNKSADFNKGIRVPEGTVLNIYGDKDSDRSWLNAKSGGYEAAIGSNDEDDDAENAAGTVNIYGSIVTATSGTDAAGIGGGNEADGGTVNIYGGEVKANGGLFGAGIGGGDEGSGGTVTIYGGTVDANGGQDAAGIGGGEDGRGSSYTQYGGRVYATGGKADSLSSGGGAGVGGGECGSQGGAINIHGGYLLAMNGSFGGAAAIGGGHDASGGVINISGGTVSAYAEWGAAIGGGEYHSNGAINITGGTVKAKSSSGAGIGSAFGKNNTQGGDILIENADVTAIAKGYGAGIGGGGHENEGGSATKITIRNSLVSAGSSFGAGIGGGGVRYGNDDGGHGGTVIIEDSAVFAISKERGAGIGGGCSGDGGTVTIKDSYVQAYGGSSSYNYIKDTASTQGIYHILKPDKVLGSFAGKYDAKVADVIVALILNDTWGGAGIGGGSNGKGANVTITGNSTVIAGGGCSGAVAIGHGLDNSDSRALTLGNNLTVKSGNNQENLQTSSVANRVEKCQSKQYAVITPCEHKNATYRGVFEGHAIDSCPDCAITFEEQELEPHSFPNRRDCAVCHYAGVKIDFDSDGLGGNMASVYITKGAEYTLPTECAFSTLYNDSKTYYLCGWKIGGTEYALGDTITVDEDITVVGVFARGNIDVIDSANGHVTTDKALAPPGTTITLTAFPDTDCRLTSIRVTAGAETIYEATEETDGTLGLTHQFTMPEGYVGVSVRSVFEKNQHQIWIDDESFSSLGADSPTVLVNGFEAETAALGDEITVAVPTDSSVVSIVCYPVDSSGTVTESSRNHSRSYAVGSDGRAVFTWFVQSPIKIAASHDHTHDGVSFSAWGSGYGESTSLPNVTGSYYLTTDITLAEPWYLQSNIILCLNGHTITPAADMDYLIHIGINRKLYIYDHDDTGSIDGDGRCGLITFDSTGGGVELNGGTLKNGFGGKAAGINISSYNTFTMHGGVITGMQKDWDAQYTRGAGVYVNGGTFVMDGGEITGNTEGSGVYVENGSIELSGNPFISGNGSIDLFLSRHNVIDITGKLAVTARVGVKPYYGSEPTTPIIVTNGFSGNGDLINFFTTDTDLALGVVDGELALGAVRTVTFDMNGGTPDRAPETAALGGDYILPQNTATKAASVFTGWKIGDTNTVLPAGETIYISDDVTLHAVWAAADEYAVIEDHIHDWEIKIDEENPSKVTVRCLDGDQCNEGVAKYAQLQINGSTGTYTTTYNGSPVTAAVYKQPNKVNNPGFYDESLIHVSAVSYMDIMGEVMDSAPVDAGVYFAQATISPATGKGEPATIRQMIIINKAQPDISVTGCELMWTDQPQKLVESTAVTDGSIIYRVNGGEWTLDPSASEIGEYEIEWYYEGENYANVHSPEEPGVVNSRITDEHVHDGVTFEALWNSEADTFPTESGNWYLSNDITLTEDVTITNKIKLCLNGKTVYLNGHKLTVTGSASLELYAHGDGAINGGDIDGSCIYIDSNAALRSHNVTFSGLYCSGSDRGAITIIGTFGMDGGSVTCCKGTLGGVCNYYGSFEITGSPVVKNNTDLDSNTLNVFLRGNDSASGRASYPITVKSGLTEDADIGVYAEYNYKYSVVVDCKFTSGFGTNCPDILPSAIFSVDQPIEERHSIWLNSDGEAVCGLHKHSYEIISQTDDTVKFRCGDVDNCYLNGRVFTLTLKAENAAYDGNEHPAEWVTDIPDNLIRTSDDRLTYSIYGYKDSRGLYIDRYNSETGKWEKCAPTASGTYTAVAYLDLGSNTYEMTTTYSIHNHAAGDTVRENETPSTCTVKGGYDEVTYCSVCGEEISRNHIEYELAPHTEQIVPGTPADCEHTGLTDGKVCSVCGATLVEQEIIPIAPHSYSEPVWVWAEDYGSATATIYCTVCGHEESAGATVTDEFTGESIVYTATAEILGQCYTDTRTISADAAASVTVGDTVTKYRTFDEAKANWIDGSTLTLLSDATINSAITVGFTGVLDLNGFTLSRNLSAATANGNAITNNGTLTITDSSQSKTGTITGGANTSAGGAIINNGTLIINGGIFTGNKAQEGGAIANKSGATLTMNDGLITGNTTTQWGGAGILNQGTMTLNGGTISGNNITAVGMNGAGIWTNSTLTITGGTVTGNTTRTGNGGGIYYSAGTVALSGSPVITGNTALGVDNDLYINGNTKLTINGVLSENAKIGVRLKTMNSNAFTNGLSGKGGVSNFISNLSEYKVSLNNSGEAYFKQLHTVTVNGSVNGSVEASAQTANEGDTITLTVTPDDGYTATVTVNGEELIPENDVYSFDMPDEDVVVSATFSFTDGIGARLVGHSISLDGDIGVNFYMELSDSVIAHKDTAYMHFIIPVGSGTTEQDMLVRDALIKEWNGKSYYVFKCRVAAKEMTSEIKAQMIDGDQSGTEYTYSVKEYADYLLEHADEREDLAAAVPLVKAMINYGANAQIYFDKNPETLANAKLEEEEKQLGEISITASETAFDLPEGVTFEGATLSLKSETTLSLYFKSNAALTFSVDGKTVETSSSGDYQIARIRGIPAKELKDSFTMTVTSGEASGSVTYSPMNYCDNALNGGTDDVNLQNVIKALYLYALAADTYFD